LKIVVDVTINDKADPKNMTPAEVRIPESYFDRLNFEPDTVKAEGLMVGGAITFWYALEVLKDIAVVTAVLL
jgi:hypothetical protein